MEEHTVLPQAETAPADHAAQPEDPAPLPHCRHDAALVELLLSGRLKLIRPDACEALAAGKLPPEEPMLADNVVHWLRPYVVGTVRELRGQRCSKMMLRRFRAAQLAQRLLPLSMLRPGVVSALEGVEWDPNARNSAALRIVRRVLAALASAARVCALSSRALSNPIVIEVLGPMLGTDRARSVTLALPKHPMSTAITTALDTGNVRKELEAIINACEFREWLRGPVLKAANKMVDKAIADPFGPRDGTQGCKPRLRGLIASRPQLYKEISAKVDLELGSDMWRRREKHNAALKALDNLVELKATGDAEASDQMTWLLEAAKEEEAFRLVQERVMAGVQAAIGRGVPVNYDCKANHDVISKASRMPDHVHFGVDHAVKQIVHRTRGTGATRRAELDQALQKYGLFRRSDSKLCKDYINARVSESLDHVVAIMRLVSFLFNKGGHRAYSHYHYLWERNLVRQVEEGMSFEEATEDIMQQYAPVPGGYAMYEDDEDSFDSY